MKTLSASIFFLLSFGINSFAVPKPGNIKKHSIAFAIDYIQYPYPSHWYNPLISTTGYDYYSKELSRSMPWAAYYFKNVFSIRVAHCFLDQYAHYKVDSLTPNGFFNQRTLSATDFTVGYNFLHKKSEKFAVWLYAGVGYGTGFITSVTSDYGQWEYPIYERDIYNWYPLAQLLVKYNPMKNVFLGLGSTYRYIPTRGTDIAPPRHLQVVSLNISAGIQFGVFNKKSR